MKHEFHKGEFVKIRDDLDYLTLYVSSGQALGLPDKSQIEYAGKVAKVFAVSSDCEKIILCDPVKGDKLLPGYWTPAMLVELSAEDKLFADVLTQVSKARAKAAEVKTTPVVEDVEVQAVETTPAKLIEERGAYALIKEIAQVSRKAFDTVKAGKKADVYFHKIKKLAEQGENIGCKDLSEKDRKFKIALHNILAKDIRKISEYAEAACSCLSVMLAPVSTFLMFADVLAGGKRVIPGWFVAICWLLTPLCYAAKTYLRALKDAKFL